MREDDVGLVRTTSEGGQQAPVENTIAKVRGATDSKGDEGMIQAERSTDERETAGHSNAPIASHADH